MRLEETVLDLIDRPGSTEDAVIDVVLRDVERAHGLPRAERNKAEPDTTAGRQARGRRRSYRDVRYVSYRLVVELDGRAAHPEDQRERDDLRDNSLVEEDGTSTLRYGWRSVSSRFPDKCWGKSS